MIHLLSPVLVCGSAGAVAGVMVLCGADDPPVAESGSAVVGGVLVCGAVRPVAEGWMGLIGLISPEPSAVPLLRVMGAGG